MAKSTMICFLKNAAYSNRINQIVLEANKCLKFEEILPDRHGYNSYISSKFPVYNLDGCIYGIASISTNINYRIEVQTLLANINQELEDRVAERTISLKKVNEQLKQEINAKNKANIIANKIANELSQNARTVNSILNTSVDPIYLFDTSGKYTYVSKNGAAYLGMEPDEMIGKTIKELRFSQEIIQQLDEQIKKVLTTGESIKSEGCFPTKGTQRDYEYIISPVLDQQENIEAVVATFRDITERRSTQLELELARKNAEAANQAKTAFLANISHELKTPLNAIIGYSDLLHEEINELGYQDLSNDLQKISFESQKLLKMIQEVIEISKIETNKIKLYLEDFNLSSLIKNAVKSVEPLVIKNGNILTVEGVEDIGIMYADPIKVQQIISNILSNAAKFTHQGEINLRVNRQREQIVISVTDNGIGISLDQIKYLFKPFTQADESTTRQYGGTGLGLAISQRFCQMMGGNITVDSKIGLGSTFTVCLPVEVADSKNENLSKHSAVSF
ncbi:MAG: PAS domain-containing sensor histidine kinase [Trichodesmium sp.]